MSIRNRDVCVVFGEAGPLTEQAAVVTAQHSSLRIVSISAGPEEWPEAGSRIANERPSLVIFCAGWDMAASVEVLRSLELGARPFVVIGPGDQMPLVLELMRLGVADFVPQESMAVDLENAVRRLTANDAEESSPGRIVSVMGVRGGVGATLTACQTAFHLAKEDARVALVDLACPTGDVALYCDLQPTVTLGDLARSGDEPDSSALFDALCHHGTSDVEVLAAPARIEDHERLTPRLVERACDALQERFDWVVVDVPRTWSATAGVVLDRSDQLLLQMTPDVASLSHMTEQLELCRRVGMSQSSTRAVLAREGASGTIPTKDVTKLLGRELDHALPNDFALSNAFANEGKPIGAGLTGSVLSRAYEELVTKLLTWQGLAPADEGSSRRRGFGQWLKRPSMSGVAGRRLWRA